MIEHLLAPETAPFGIALAILLFIALLEGVGLLIGVAFSSMVDSVLPDFDVPDADMDVEAGVHGPDFDTAAGAGPFTRLLGWLCFGRVPALILLIAFLTAFGITGLVVQSVAKSLSGFYLPAIVAVVPAFAAALPATRYLGLLLSRIMPKEETEAVSQADFIGKIAIVTQGRARRGLPAQAKLADKHGQSHYVQVEPDGDEDEFDVGSEVLIVRQSGGRFRVIENTYAALSAASPSDDSEKS